MLRSTAKSSSDILDTKSVVSSTYIRGDSDYLSMCIRKQCDTFVLGHVIRKTAASTEPWGTPLLIGRGVDLVFGGIMLGTIFISSKLSTMNSTSLTMADIVNLHLMK